MPFLKTDNITTTIYEYNRGDKIAKIDPAIAWRKLNSACRELGTTFEKIMEQWNETIINKEDTENEKIRKSVLFSDLEPKIEKITRVAFGIPELDDEGHGGTVALAIATLNEFLSEREKKSENTETLPSSSPSTDGDRQDSSKESSVSRD